MSIQVRQGTPEDIDAVAQLYDEVTDHLARTVELSWWEQGIYPARGDAVGGVAAGELFVATEGDAVVGSVILRPSPEPAYLPVKWQIDCDYSELYVIHTLAVSPRAQGRGVGSGMLRFAEQIATSNGKRALRLDVYVNNPTAIALYEKCGYRYIDTVSLGLEHLGLDWFRLYEKLLP